ncbi:unnamed protein product [Pieris brassicae]|uniref:Uncharacterized protein n=1 Tax=Pieris brassicae TaxID=7116 RepID=A0A9P0XAE7_PIEBR|nr:unnamed protein product [Pieris brassicae]
MMFISSDISSDHMAYRVLADLQWGPAFPIGLSQTYCSVRNTARRNPSPHRPSLTPLSPGALGAIIFDGRYVLASVRIA